MKRRVSCPQSLEPPFCRHSVDTVRPRVLGTKSVAPADARIGDEPQEDALLEVPAETDSGRPVVQLA